MWQLIIITLVCVSAKETELKRNITSETICQEPAKLIYTVAEGPLDVLHYLLTTNGSPSLLAARTSKDSRIKYDCKKLENLTTTGESISFTSVPLDMFAVSFNKLFEYNDEDDTANLTNQKEITSIDLSNSSLEWTASLNNTTSTVMWTIHNSSQVLSLKTNGSFSIVFQHYGEDGEAEKLPHLQHNANITQVQLILDNLMPAHENSRFAVEVTLFSKMNGGPSANSSYKLVSSRSIDDEHTPGVFELLDWTVRSDDKGGYMQWKPVCYTWDPPSITNSTMAKHYTVENATFSSSVYRLVYAVVGKETETLTLKSTNISFGLTKDKFYKYNNYTAWTVTIGYGTPPTEGVSLLIILIISIGLGIPVLLIVGGGVTMCVKKRKSKDGDFSSSYTRIQ